MANPLARFFGRTVSEGAAFAAGTAIGPVLRPILQEEMNAVWTLHPVRPPSAEGLAAGVAQGQVDETVAKTWAAHQGIGGPAFDALVNIANTGPDMQTAYVLWRRDFLDDAAFKRAGKRAALEPEWIDALVKAKQLLLSLAEIANAVQQGHLPNRGVLPDVSAAVTPAVGQSAPDTPDGQPPSHVPLTQIDIDPIVEARHAGYDEDRLRVVANLSGLPPGAETLLAMWNRGYLDEESVNAGIREGHLKTKWAGAFKRMRWAVLTAAEYAGLHLRGWIDQKEMYAGGALTGHTKDQMNKLYLLQGRPIAPVQAFNAWARGAPGPTGLGYPRGPHDFDEKDFQRAIQQSNIRTEYGPALWALRWAYPSLFQLRRAVQDGGLSPARARAILHIERYEKQDIDSLLRSWTIGTATTAKGLTAADLAAEYEGLYLTRDAYITEIQGLGYDAAQAAEKADAIDAKRVRTARGQAIGRIHSVYVGHRITRDAAVAALELEQVPEPARDLVLTEWDHEREVNVSVLTPIQIKKAFQGALWTRQKAIDELEFRGYSLDDANTLLDEPR